jgi:putative transposase
MRTSRFTNEQVAMALRQVEAGTPVAEICRKLEITETRSIPDRPDGGPARAAALARPTLPSEGSVKAAASFHRTGS